MTDFYVNGSVGGTANIFLENGATSRSDFGWRCRPLTTDANITVDNSTLNGAQTGPSMTSLHGGNKNFTLGSAIFIDLSRPSAITPSTW